MSSDTAAPAKVVSRSQAVWRGAHLFDAGPPGRTHRIDADAKEAPGPVETLLNALATCSGTDVVDIIGKRKTPVEALTIAVTADRRAEYPRRVQALDIEFRIDGPGIEREHAERAIQLSFEKYCTVAASLAPDISARTRLTLNGETFPPVKQNIWTAADAAEA
ncbi:MAG TPA: OsmC family protein [Gemmatimonadaceae bacterium]|jgi:putative redox protein|nr:OsmC family protein [Gemmatimonadaceae bacterium]